MAKQEEKDEDVAFEQEFFDIPSPRKRAKMSPEKLAILLSQQKPGKPAYILVEHELNLRIAMVQSRATIWSGWLGVFGALLGAAVGFSLGILFPQIIPQHIEHYQYENHNQGIVPIPKPPAPSLVMPRGKDVDVQPTESEDKKKQNNP